MTLTPVKPKDTTVKHQTSEIDFYCLLFKSHPHSGRQLIWWQCPAICLSVCC